MLNRTAGDIKYVIERSKKVSCVKITVDAGKGAVVTVPDNYSLRSIEQVVCQKSAWIKQKLEHLAEQVGCVVPRQFVDGDKFFFLGERYELKVGRGQELTRPAVQVFDDILHVLLTRNARNENGTEMVRIILEKWYYKQAADIIGSRVHFYAAAMALKPAGIRIKRQKCCWGSCSARGNLNFNYKLIMAPTDIIDYVVVHELCHLRRMDHSRYFWEEVASVLPDFKKRRRWLKEYGPALSL